MRLEDLTIVLRPRQSWEAVDLGCTLVRRDYGRVLGLWAITVLPLWAILAVLLWKQPFWFGLIVWWLKPLYDRVPLYFISNAAFGVKPRLGQTLKAWPRLWTRFLFSALIWRRLSLIRSFSLPVWMLEGQRGAAVRQRVKSLATEGFSPAGFATFAFVKLELVVAMGLFALTSSFAPEAGVPDFSELVDFNSVNLDQSLSYAWYLNALYLIAVTVVEPFYVGAGFGLYLNSRTKLEGWDIELTFRKLAARLRSAAVALVVLSSLLTSTVHAISIPTYDSPLVTERARSFKVAPKSGSDEITAKAKEILAKPEFEVHKKKQTIWIPKGNEDKAKISPGAFSLSRLIFPLLGRACLSFLLGLLVWWIVRNRHLFKFGLPTIAPREKPKGPRVVMGLDIASDSLPADLLSAARAAWSQGHLREALSLLYRGALSRLVEQRRLPIRDSDTEDDCLVHVAKSGEAGVTDYFRQLTRLWVRAAYAGIEAGADEFEDLCRTWPFDAPRSKSSAASRIILLGLLLPLLSGCDGEWKEIEITQGYKGAARSNPFLAAEQLLKEECYSADRLNALSKLPDTTGAVLVLSGEGGMTEARSRQLLAWVGKGNHLMYAMAGCRPYNDWSPSGGMQRAAYFGNDSRIDPLLQSLNVTATDERQTEAKKKKDMDDDDEAPEEPQEKPEKKKTFEETLEEPESIATRKDTLHWLGKDYLVEMPIYLTFKLGRELRRNEFSAGDREKATILGLHYGNGLVTLLNHAWPFRNRYLADQDHAAWLVAMAGNQGSKVQFVLTIETSIWKLLWQKAWMPLLGLAALVLFWLWRSLPRFGPVRYAELHDTKHFTQHIGALGQFFHSLRRDDILLNAAADSVRARALRRFPHLRDAGVEALLPLLAERSGLSEERIQTILAPAVPSQPYHLVRLLQDLQTLRQALA